MLKKGSKKNRFWRINDSSELAAYVARARNDWLINNSCINLRSFSHEPSEPHSRAPENYICRASRNTSGSRGENELTRQHDWHSCRASCEGDSWQYVVCAWTRPSFSKNGRRALSFAPGENTPYENHEAVSSRGSRRSCIQIRQSIALAHTFWHSISLARTQSLSKSQSCSTAA